MPRTALAYLPLPAPLRRVESRPRTRRWPLSPFSRHPRVQPKPRQGVKNRAPRYASGPALKTHENPPGITPVAPEAVVGCSVAAKGEMGGLATEIGILRDAAKGKGNFGLGQATAQDAGRLGEAWVGKGYTVASDGKTLISADGLRQFRPPSFKPRLGIQQSNFEQRLQPEGRWQSNGHLDIVP